MAFTMPQWLSAVIFFFIYNNFGILGLHLLVILIGVLIILLFYKINMEISKNKIISIITTTILGVLLQKYIITRPQIFTYLILLIELLCLEKYTKKSENKVFNCFTSFIYTRNKFTRFYVDDVTSISNTIHIKWY